MRRDMRRAIPTVALAAVLIVVLVLEGVAGASSFTLRSSPAGRSKASADLSIIQTSSSHDNVMVGPTNLAPATLSQPTTAGDLLVAAVICGTVQNGVPNATLRASGGWKRAKDAIGGYEGDGLQAALFYYPNNPGGLVATPSLGKVPHGSTIYCTVFVWELAGAGPNVTVDTSGKASYPHNAGIVQVSAAKPTKSNSDFVIAVETDGSGWNTREPTSYGVSSPFNLESVSNEGYVNQPGAMAFDADAPLGSTPSATFSMNQEPEDGVATIVALHEATS